MVQGVPAMVFGTVPFEAPCPACGERCEWRSLMVAYNRVATLPVCCCSEPPR
jgi:hypothetical protein